MSFSYANPVSGPSAGGIGWFNFGSLSLAPGQSQLGLTGTLNDGTVVKFDVSVSNISGANRTFTAGPVPTWGGAFFGNTNYTSVAGNVALNSSLTFALTNNAITISNITVVDPLNNPVPNYTVLVGDAESTGVSESWTFNTNGAPWNLFTTIGTTTNPTLTGLGTQTTVITGNNPAINHNEYILSTQNPTNLVLSTATTSVNGGQQAIVIGFATTHVRVQKNIAGRADPADQFTLNIGGAPSGTATTTGATSGLQTPIANVFAVPASTYSISEAMAPGSVSPLSAYTQVVSVSNATPAGSVPPTGSLPISFTPALGDDVTYTILNVAPEKFTKTVDKAYADLNGILTYTVLVKNPNNFALANVLVNDPTPVGTTFVPASLVVVGSAHTGTDPNSGVTLTSIPANTTATLTWQVKVNSLPPISNPVTNVAMVNVPGGTSGPTNAVTTQVNTAYVTVNKVRDLAFAKAGDIITYTMLLNNAGNVAANNVVLTDAIPAGTTFVAGSVTGATGTPPTLTVPSIPAGGNATVTFKVQVGNTVPVPNPIPNSASVAYTYTVDPAVPNGATGTHTSNTVTTQANMAIVTTTKAVDAAYGETDQILTYTITVKNTGNVPANNVVITDNIPADTTFVAGSVTGATGTPPTLTVPSVPANGTAVVTFKVKVSSTIPLTNPLVNTASTAFTYTVDPAVPNGASGTAPSNPVTTHINDANIATVKTVDKTITDIGTVLTYTLTLTNSGNVPANNVVITDAAPAGTTYINGSLIGATGAPPTMNIATIPAGGTAVVTYQVLVGNAIPTPNPIPNTANVAFVFTLDPANPNGKAGTSASNTVNTQVNSAIIATVKTVDKAFANVGDTLTYTITVTNSGNVPANNTVLTDTLPAGVTFVAGSVTNATGTPPTLTLTSPIPAGGSVIVTYKVLVGAVVPNPNPVENSAKAAFTYTVDPTKPNGASGTSYSNVVGTEVNTAKLLMTKSVDKFIAYIGDTITYQIAVTNTGNVAANNVIITDAIPVGTVLVPGSMVVSAPFTTLSGGAISLTNPVLPAQTVTISFKVLVTAIPNPNPIVNVADAAYTYTVDPAHPNGESATAKTNSVTTIVFRNNFKQQITDLIESVALEEAAIAAIANAEGAKIQRIAAMPDVTTQQLLCLNKSVADMADSLSLLEAILRQKLSVVDCQINGEHC